MRNLATKIILIVLSGWLFYSCSLVKRVPDGKHLLKKNDVRVNGEEKNDDEHKAQLYQLPNTNVLGWHIRLNIYNLANPNADSSYTAWLGRHPGWHSTLTKTLSEKQVYRLGNSFIVSGFSNFAKKTGEPPVIVDLNKIKKSRNRLFAYYYKQGYFRAKVNYTIDTLENKRAVVNYNIATGKPYKLDTITAYIETPALDSLYGTMKTESLLKKGEQYNETNFTGERERVTNYFRNHGAYTFQPNNISYVIDTVGNNYKANVDFIIDSETVRQGDSTFVRPFRLYKISQVNIFTKNPRSKDQELDSVSYNGFKIYSTGRLNYRPKALTDPIFITPGSDFADYRRVQTSRYLGNLRVFDYPLIQYVQDPADSTGTSLITNIYLNPRKKFRFVPSVDFTHSNIQDFGILGSLGVSIRNIFKGAEILDISTRGNIGSSRDPAIRDRSFFNILEYGATAKLTFPRIFFPFKTDRIIPKEMIPSTLMSFGISRQRNIGLDKENFTGVLSYNWTPDRRRSAKLDLFNIQYIRNVNANKYFNVYKSSYDRLNDYANEYASQVNPGYFEDQQDPTADRDLKVDEGTNGFINDVLATPAVINVSAEDERNISRIKERRDRLTENNLVFATNFTYTINSQENRIDNAFYVFKTKLESAGGMLSLLSGLMDENKNVPEGSRTIFDVQYSQYIKGEVDFIKHFDLKRGKVLAMRAFFGLAVPYGNSTSIPFARSYFAGGSNDNRAWQSYSLGPGRSGGLNDFNEANLKMAYSAELRFNIFGKLNGAVFGDVGNIWNIWDEVDDPNYTFNGLKSFEDLALGSGFGFRYDFNFFVVRFDLGFKTYNPGRSEGDRWFKEYNFSRCVYNVGINYPF